MIASFVPLAAYLLVPTSSAATHTVDMAVPFAAPQWQDGVQVTVRHLGMVAAHLPDQVVQSTWSHINCRVKDGNVVVVFDAAPDDWPAQIPPSVSCQAGPDTLVVNLVPDLDGQAAVDAEIDVGASGTTVEAAPNRSVVRHHRLVGYGDVLEGSYVAVLGGSEWPGVRCDVAENSKGESWVRLTFARDSPAGAGACDLPLVGGGTVALPLALSR